MSIESFGEPSSERDTDRQTPTPSSGDDDSIVDPGSVNVSDIVSPSSVSRPSKAKKKRVLNAWFYCKITEPRREKTGLRGFRPGLTQTGLYSHRSRLEA